MPEHHGFGRALPRLGTPVPGPASRALARRLAAVESRNITRIADDGPIFWDAAAGANVRDADGNVYVDLTAGFSVAAAGHAHPEVAAAIAAQAARLPHALGDVYPAAVKVELLERLAALAPGRLGVAVLASAGAEAVEAALKTAALHTGRPGVIAFTGAYHGLTLGALATTWRADFRAPFLPQLFPGVGFAPYPDTFRDGPGALAASLAEVRRLVDEGVAGDGAGAAAASVGGRRYPVGAILVEPVQGRGGLRVPPAEFLPALRRLCDEEGLVLICDEVYTGFGRTGRWFACEHTATVPDLLVVGKALSGTLPLSAVIGTPEVMAAWPPSAGEAIHTSTFLGNPVSCAAALAHLTVLQRDGLIERSAALGRRLGERLATWRRSPAVGDVRGLGLMRGVELVDGEGAGGLALDVAARALRRGVLILAEGPAASVLAFTPPLVITEAQLDFAVEVVESQLDAALRDLRP
jgi:4-aminobutyrate aminotransferase / (S)-3-amino-2-methylpropionate transaminase / 5-aminovalerate transaminase